LYQGTASAVPARVSCMRALASALAAAEAVSFLAQIGMTEVTPRYKAFALCGEVVAENSIRFLPAIDHQAWNFPTTDHRRLTTLRPLTNDNWTRRVTASAKVLVLGVAPDHRAPEEVRLLGSVHSTDCRLATQAPRAGNAGSDGHGTRRAGGRDSSEARLSCHSLHWASVAKPAPSFCQCASGLKKSC